MVRLAKDKESTTTSTKRTLKTESVIKPPKKPKTKMKKEAAEKQKETVKKPVTPKGAQAVALSVDKATKLIGTELSCSVILIG